MGSLLSEESDWFFNLLHYAGRLIFYAWAKIIVVEVHKKISKEHI